MSAARGCSLLIPPKRHDRSLRATAARHGHRSLVSRAQATARDVARRLWEYGTSADTPVHPYAHETDATGAVAMRLLNDLEVALSRWIGAEGYRALLLNAARQTLPAHPALNAVLTVDGFRPATPRNAAATTDALASGVVALLEVLMELLGRIIGDEMAVRLVDQAGAPHLSSEIARHREQRHPPRTQ